MLRKTMLASVALAVGLWAALGDVAPIEAQKGGGGSRGGGGGNRGGGSARPSSGGGGRSAPSVRSSPAPSIRSSSAPSVRSTPAPSIRSTPAPSIRSSSEAPRLATSPSGGSKNSNSNRNNDSNRSASTNASSQKNSNKSGGNSSGIIQAGAIKNLEGNSNKNNNNRGDRLENNGGNLSKGDNTAKNNNGTGKAGKNNGNAAVNAANARNLGGLSARNAYYNGNRDWDDDHFRYRGGHYHHRHHHDNFWRFLLYSAIADRLGFGYGYGFGYWPYSYGFWPYHYGYLNDVGPYWAQSPQYVEPPIVNARATIEVRLPDPNAQVWIDGRETTSRGTERTYNSPTLEGGYDYSYLVRATWEQDGEIRTVERQIAIVAGDHVVVDFTQSPTRVYRPEE